MADVVGLVILAAGSGTRLGGVAKALLRLPDGRTFLDAIVGTAREVGLGDAVIVVGAPFGDAVGAAGLALGCTPAENPEPQRGMASSVATGFAALDRLAGDACTAAWLWPVDHPGVTPATLRTLIASLASHAAARPTFGGRGGHPPLVARSLWPARAACADLEGGARTVLAAADVVDVAVDDRGVVRDVDVPADLEAR
jgi:CTP:molybdopterin cytidylyltransferase MocA